MDPGQVQNITSKKKPAMITRAFRKSVFLKIDDLFKPRVSAVQFTGQAFVIIFYG